MDNAIVIKTATQEDAAVIAALAKEIWTQHYTPIIGVEQIEYMLNKFQSQSAVKADISGGYTYYIAYLRGSACGYSAVRQDSGVFLSKFYVKQNVRGQGVGKAMLRAINAYAKECSAHRIWLTCNKRNTNTLAVYQKLGFVKIDEVIADIGGGFMMDDFVLELLL